MKFRITRTSVYDFDHKLDVSRIHPRAYRENKQEYIDIDNLEDLIEFSVKVGEIIIHRDSIEIYDYCRE